MYKILIADDHPLFRDAITSVIHSGFSGCETLEADELESTLTLTRNNDDIDLILLDLNMPGMNGLHGLITLRNEVPFTPVVIVSAEEDKQIIMQAVTYGAAGFIPKSTPREQMRLALEKILAGNTYIPADVIKTEPTPSNEPAISNEIFSSLTRRQLLVLERMSMGESNKQIAYNLNIAETTVKAHVSAILRKLGVHNRMQAVLCAGNLDFNQAR
ncbi:MAG: response regulator transcription factor [Marinobacterium sp.]|nr:response regulator transcription factor [Marinobacterium sp.]